jgi:endonuclease YncB( thermonuclease family)
MVTPSIRPRPPFRAMPLPPAGIATREFALKLCCIDALAGLDNRTLGICNWVFDGDTIEVWADHSPLVVRLVGLDAPEIFRNGLEPQPGAIESKNALTNLVLGMHVCLITTAMQPAHDQYGRRLAHVIRYPDMLHVGLELIRQGWARPWPRYPHELTSQFAAAAKFAATMHFGLWKQTDLPPQDPPENQVDDHVA